MAAWARARSGGANDDTYVLRDLHRIDPLLPKFTYDSVIETAGEGVDTIRVERVGIMASYTLGADIENGIVTGADSFALTGNGLANRLTGNGAANTLNGSGGNDVLNGLAGHDALPGGLGNDTLNGGADFDAFIFNTPRARPAISISPRASCTPTTRFACRRASPHRYFELQHESPQFRAPRRHLLPLDCSLLSDRAVGAAISGRENRHGKAARSA